LGRAKMKKREDARRVLAIELFSVYADIVRIFMTAERILADLAVFVNGSEAERGELINGLHQLVQDQMVALSRLRDDLQKVSGELIVLDAKDFETLAWITAGKFGDLQTVLWDLGSGRIYRQDLGGGYPNRPSARVFDLQSQ